MNEFLNQVIQGDCLDVMKSMPENCIDTVITDPPYGLKFMGKEWDHGVPGEQFWAEALRVAKPGAMLLAFGGTRTHHRLMVAIEDAGWQIRDCMMWLTGQGFPKSKNFGCKCGGKALPYNHGEQETKHDLRPVREADLSASVDTEAQSGQVLFDGLQEQSTSECRPTRSEPEAGGRKQSSVARRQLRRTGQGVSNDPQPQTSEGAKERLRVGTHSDSGTDVGATTTIRRGGSSQEPRQTGQQPGESKDIQFASRALGDRTSGDDSICQTCGGLVNFRGYGTGLKPAYEIIVIAMKPLDGTFAENAIEHGVAGFNIDAGRVTSSTIDDYGRSAVSADGIKKAHNGFEGKSFKIADRTGQGTHSQGRWPANLVLSHTPECREVGTKKIKGHKHSGKSGTGKKSMFGMEMNGASKCFVAADGTETVAAWECSEDCPVRQLDEQSGVTVSRQSRRAIAGHDKGGGAALNSFPNEHDKYGGHNDAGGASRFFYCAKASRSERNAGLPEGSKNTHPTVKPLKLMEYLCKLTMTPTGGIVLDPFAGSGSTLLAAQNVGREFIGIELDKEHCETARLRLGGTLFSKVATA